MTEEEQKKFQELIVEVDSPQCVIDELLQFIEEVSIRAFKDGVKAGYQARVL
jgi:hypothetical protein